MKSLFNFYLEDSDKKAIQAKLDRLLGETSKGSLAAFLRVQVKKFLATPDDKISSLLLEAITAEYEVSQIKNKRSKL